MSGCDRRASAQVSGRAGAVQQGRKRGRPSGARRGEPRSGARLNVIETLRAAAPWQKIRHAEAERLRPIHAKPGARALVQVRRDDFHVTRYKQRSATTTLFVVDASGSSALNRLAEAKGAVELLLADCYVRRDQVAVLAFRGRGAELLLPPTRSLVRAKRSLAGLPGGGGTPLASGIDAAAALAASIKRRGETPIVVLLSDRWPGQHRPRRQSRAGACRRGRAAGGPSVSRGGSARLADRHVATAPAFVPATGRPDGRQLPAAAACGIRGVVAGRFPGCSCGVGTDCGRSMSGGGLCRHA